MYAQLDTVLDKAGITTVPVGLYDLPDPNVLAPLVRPADGRWACVFMFYRAWQRGASLHLTRDNCGCGGVGTYLFGRRSRPRQASVDFLYGEEKLKDSGDLIGEWVDSVPLYSPRFDHIVIGPLNEAADEFLVTATFLINPDQLSLFVTGAHYHHGPSTPARVTAPFASGCGLLGPGLMELDGPAAMIGATDIAMRSYVPADILAFTVNRPMLANLSRLGEGSFLDGPFWQAVVRKRRGKAGTET